MDNALKFRIANKSDKPRIVYIYTKKGLMEGGSPFASYSLAHTDPLPLPKEGRGRRSPPPS